MTTTTNKFAAAFAAILLMSGLWAQTLAPVAAAPSVTMQTQLA